VRELIGREEKGLEVAFEQQQYLFAIGGWKPEGHKPIRAGSKFFFQN